MEDQIKKSLNEIVQFGIDPSKIAIENLDYPFEWIEDLVKEFGFHICLDIGHILLYGQDLKLYFEKYLNKTSVIHLHGNEDGRDHLGLDRLRESTLEIIFSNLEKFKGIVSIEVFSIEDLARSLIRLDEAWEKR